MAYLLDTNVFITAKNSFYGFDFCPAFWSWLDQAAEAGVVRSVERVHDELIERGDDLSAWARDRRGLFLPFGADDVASVAAVNRWARSPGVVGRTHGRDARDDPGLEGHDQDSKCGRRSRSAVLHAVPHATGRAGPIRA